jgi:hypothetical protein
MVGELNILLVLIFENLLNEIKPDNYINFIKEPKKD